MDESVSISSVSVTSGTSISTWSPMSTSTWSPSSSSTAAAPGATHTVQVGYNERQFSPNITQAQVGDIIEFDFLPKNHSVVRAEYMFPCEPYETTGAGKIGFFSGFYVVSDTSSSPKWRLAIKDSNPIYYYSSASDDCNKWGMVGAINADQAGLKMQYDMSFDSPEVVQPSSAFGSNADSTSTPTTSLTPIQTSNSAQSTNSSITGSTVNGTSISPGALGGIVVGSVALVAFILVSVFYFMGRRRNGQSNSHLRQNAGGPGGGTYVIEHPSPESTTASPLRMVPHGAFYPGSPMAENQDDTIFVPVKRSQIMSGEFQWPAGGSDGSSTVGHDRSSGDGRSLGTAELGPTNPARWSMNTANMPSPAEEDEEEPMPSVDPQQFSQQQYQQSQTQPQMQPQQQHPQYNNMYAGPSRTQSGRRMHELGG